MKLTSIPRPAILSLGLLAGVCLALAGAPVVSAAGAAAAKPEAKPELRRVEAAQVCMIHNEVFTDQKMLPVKVEGHTYYAFCGKCKADLANNADDRTAVDPISRKPVDKAKAVIAAKPNGKVLYFESVENLKKYNAGNGNTGG